MSSALSDCFGNACDENCSVLQREPYVLVVFDLAFFVVVLMIVVMLVVIVLVMIVVFVVFMVIIFVVVVVFIMIVLIMVVIFVVLVIMVLIFIVVVLMLVVVTFHAFDDLFFLDGIAECFHKVNYDHVLVCCFLEDVVDPLVRLAADVNEYVACGDLEDVGCSGLVAVKVCAVIEKHCDFSVCRVVAKDVHYPVVFREDGCYYLQVLVSLSCRSLAACCEAACRQCEGSKY